MKISTLMNARIDATFEVEHAVVAALCEVLKKHGPDPQLNIILLVGMKAAIREIDRKIYPGFLDRLRRDLAEEAA